MSLAGSKEPIKFPDWVSLAIEGFDKVWYIDPYNGGVATVAKSFWRAIVETILLVGGDIDVITPAETVAVVG